MLIIYQPDLILQTFYQQQKLLSICSESDDCLWQFWWVSLGSTYELINIYHIRSLLEMHRQDLNRQFSCAANKKYLILRCNAHCPMATRCGVYKYIELEWISSELASIEAESIGSFIPCCILRYSYCFQWQPRTKTKTSRFNCYYGYASALNNNWREFQHNKTVCKPEETSGNNEFEKKNPSFLLPSFLRMKFDVKKYSTWKMDSENPHALRN